MQFYNVTNKEKSLYHDCLYKLGIDRADTTTLPLVDFTRSANNWYRRINSWIWSVTGEWEYDDSNYIDLPIATCDLVASQQDYSLPSTIQKIDRVEVKDSNGDWVKLQPMDKSQLYNTALTEFEETPGLPSYYDVLGSSLMLYPAPATASVTITNGLKLYFSRDIDEFEITDTTKEPGFVNSFHEVISLGSALDFSEIIGDTTKINLFRSEIDKIQKELNQFYGSREREMLPSIKRKYNTNKRN